MARKGPKLQSDQVFTFAEHERRGKYKALCDEREHKFVTSFAWTPSGSFSNTQSLPESETKQKSSTRSHAKVWVHPQGCGSADSFRFLHLATSLPTSYRFVQNTPKIVIAMHRKMSENTQPDQHKIHTTTEETSLQHIM